MARETTQQGIPSSRWQVGYRQYVALEEAFKEATEDLVVETKKILVRRCNSVFELRGLYDYDREWFRIRLLHTSPEMFSDERCRIVTDAAFFLASVEVMGDRVSREMFGD